jgi:Na+/phosphate symporter
VIHAVFIIHNGICLFSRQYSKKTIKKYLFSAFLTAINQFAKEISKKHLKKIIIEDEIFSMSVIENLLFVYKHDDIKESKMERISNELSTRFIELFKPELKNWDGDVSFFNKFKEEADKILAMKGKSTLIEMEQFLQKKKFERLSEKKEKTMKGESTLLEMEEFLHKKNSNSEK